jgi:hypothetical protein
MIMMMGRQHPAFACIAPAIDVEGSGCRCSARCQRPVMGLMARGRINADPDRITSEHLTV